MSCFLYSCFMWIYYYISMGCCIQISRSCEVEWHELFHRLVETDKRRVVELVDELRFQEIPIFVYTRTTLYVFIYSIVNIESNRDSFAQSPFLLVTCITPCILLFWGVGNFRLGTVPGYVINQAFHAIHTHKGCDSWSSIPLPVVSLPGVIPRFAYCIF